MNRFTAFLRTKSLAFPAAALVVLALIVTSELATKAAAAAAAQSRESGLRQSKVNELVRLVLDLETAQRGFAITGDTVYLDTYRDSLESLTPAMDQLRDLYAKSELGVSKLSSLTRSTMRKLAEMEVVIKLRESSPQTADWKSAGSTGLGRAYMDDVRNASNELLEAERALHARYNRSFDDSLVFSRAAIVTTGLLGLLAFGLYLREWRSHAHAVQKQTEALSQEREQLQRLVDERTTELQAFANHLIGVQERERDYVARELHDELGSILTAAKFDLSRIESRIAHDNEELKRRVTHLVDLLNRGIAVKRRLIEDLRPSALSRLGLGPAVEALARDFESKHPITVRVHVEPGALSHEAELSIYRVIQESLTNIANHAKASEVVVQVLHHSHVVEVSIRDNGIGFELNGLANVSHGIPGMQHRVRSLGGRLEIEAAPGKGCVIRANLPLPQAQTLSSSAASPVALPATPTSA